MSNLSKIKDKVKSKISSFPAILLTGLMLGITSTGGVIEFDQADKDAIGQGFTNALSNLWNGFTVILPYIGMTVGVILVIGLAFKLVFKRS